jgi:hypothetical protein
MILGDLLHNRLKGRIGAKIAILVPEEGRVEGSLIGYDQHVLAMNCDGIEKLYDLEAVISLAVLA